MAVLLLSLSSAFFVGLSNVLIRKGLDRGTKIQAIFISLLTSTSLFWILAALFVDRYLFLAPAVFLFFIAGIFGQGIGRTLNITSLERIGVARTIPLTGIAPFFATLGAILFLGEKFSLPIFGGIILIIFGIYVLSRVRNGDGKVFEKRDLILPLGSAFFGGISLTVSKKALIETGEPLLGATLAGTAALLMVFVSMLWGKHFRQLPLAPGGIKLFILAGLSMAAAFLLNFSALKIGDVSIVAPVFSTFPLFGVLLSHLLLKEQITGRTWLGAIIIMLGIMVIHIF
ncbi:MAG: DMT family transporter [Patescibacteria group bacterium]